MAGRTQRWRRSYRAEQPEVDGALTCAAAEEGGREQRLGRRLIVLGAVVLALAAGAGNALAAPAVTPNEEGQVAPAAGPLPDPGISADQPAPDQAAAEGELGTIQDTSQAAQSEPASPVDAGAGLQPAQSEPDSTPTQADSTLTPDRSGATPETNQKPERRPKPENRQKPEKGQDSKIKQREQPSSPPGAGTVETEAQDEQSEASTQEADGTATSGQQGTSNENVSVRNDEPGSDGSVTQENTSTAEASATNDSWSGPSGGCDQDAHATATANQEDASNTNASVRVNSPGDNDDVTQTNSSEATATASNSCAGAQDAQATATATQEDASNANVSVRVFSDGDNGEVTQANTADATATETNGDGSDASGTEHEQQIDPQNINVSIRVESDGQDGPVNQTNGRTGTRRDRAERGSGSLDVSVESDGENTDVSIELDSDALTPVDSDEFWLWVWEWSWEGDPNNPPDWDAIAAAIDGWNWDFSNPGAAIPGGPGAEQVGAAGGIEAGTWAWTWEFVTEDESIDWSWNKTLDGCNCAWIWIWNWVWVEAASGSSAPPEAAPGAPASSEPSAPQTADQTARQTSPSVSQINNSSAVAEATNESTVEHDGDLVQDDPVMQPTRVSQSAIALAESTQAGAQNGGSRNQTTKSSAEAIAANTSRVAQSSTQNGSGSGEQRVEQPAQVVQSATATAVAPRSSGGGNRSESAMARAENVSEIEQSNQIDAQDNGNGSGGGDSVAVICNATEIDTTCIQSNEASVNQTAVANGDALARNTSRIEQANQIAGRDNRSSDADEAPSFSSADVCNSDGPTTNCVQVNTVGVVQEAVAVGDGALAQNEAEAVAVNQIAGRDTAAGAAAWDNQSGDSAAGVCNAGGPATNCAQENDIEIAQEATAEGRSSVENEAEVMAVNQIAGRDTAGGAASGGSSSGNSAAGVCNAGGPTTNCAQANSIEIAQVATTTERSSVENEAAVVAMNQIAGRDTAAGAARTTERSGDSAAGVCNAGGPTTNCTQANTLGIAQEARGAGKGSAGNDADVTAANQIAGRDAYDGVTRVNNESGNSAAGVCNVGGEARNCTQENGVEVAQEAYAGAGRGSVGNEVEVATANQIVGRDAAAGATRVISLSGNSAAGVCNAGGPAVNCTQENGVVIAQEAYAGAGRGSAGNEAEVAAVNQIAGRDVSAGAARVSSVSGNSAAGVCNAGGPATNCTQQNDVQITQEATADGSGSVENEAEVATANGIAGRDTYEGPARVKNRSRDSSAGVCNAGGETTNCTQLNTVDVVQQAAAGLGKGAVEHEAEVVAVNQIAGRDAVAGSVRVRNRTLDGSADVCNSDGETPGCTQENSVFIDGAGRVRAIKQVAGRNRYVASSWARNRSRSAFAVSSSGLLTNTVNQRALKAW